MAAATQAQMSATSGSNDLRTGALAFSGLITVLMSGAIVWGFLLAPHIQSGADHGIGQVAGVAGFDPQDQPGPLVRLGLHVLGNPLLGRLSARQKADKATLVV
jgi:hypothetical protein